MTTSETSVISMVYTMTSSDYDSVYLYNKNGDKIEDVKEVANNICNN